MVFMRLAVGKHTEDLLASLERASLSSIRLIFFKQFSLFVRRAKFCANVYLAFEVFFASLPIIRKALNNNF